MIRFAETHPALADDEIRRGILEHVERNGPSPLSSLPRRWPLTGFHLRLVAAQLAREGLVTVTRDGGAPPRLGLTDAGRALLPTPPHDP